MSDKNVRFIRKNGKVIPIRDKNSSGTSSYNIKKKDSAYNHKRVDMAIAKSMKPISTAKRFEMAATVGAVGAMLGVMGGKKGALVGGALGAVFGGSIKKMASRKDIEKNLRRKKK